jgi:DNA-binding CsgD family transcriptional regulator
MGYLISNTDLQRIEAAQRTLLDPEQAESMTDWLKAAASALRTLLQADAAHAFAAREGAPPIQAGDRLDPGFFEGITTYFACAAAGDPAAQDGIGPHIHMQQTRVAGGPGVYHERALANRSVIEASPFYQDVCVPHGIQYTTGISTPWKESEAAVCVSFTSDDAPGYDPASSSLLRLLVPAFEAGLAYWARHARIHNCLRRAIDTLSEPAVLFDADGEEMHRNRAACRLLAEEPQAERIMDVAAAMAEGGDPPAALLRSSSASSFRGAAPQQQVEAAEVTYRLRACVVRPDPAGPPAVMVTIERLSIFPPPSVLERRVGLTPREAEVAVLVAHGASNADLAERLHISPHTARHHVASILKTLDVSSRSHVAAVILERTGRG